MNLSAQQTLETYIVMLAALCGGLAAWLLSGWLLRWTARRSARLMPPPKNNEEAQHEPASTQTVDTKSSGTPS